MKPTTDAQQLLKHWQQAVPDDRLAHLIKDVARAQLRALQYRLAMYEISIGHWAFLRVLWERNGLTQRELSDAVGVMEPTTLAAVKSLEAQGYLTREQRNGNRKNIHISLTRAGRALKKKLVPLAEDVNAVSVQGIPKGNVALVRSVLLRMLVNLANEGDPRVDV